MHEDGFLMTSSKFIVAGKMFLHFVPYLSC